MFEFGSLRPYFSQFVAVLTGSIALISNGVEYGWASPALHVLFSNNTPLKPPPQPSEMSNVSNLLSTLYMGGGICGLPLTFTMLTYLGRRRTLLTFASVGLVCWVLMATTNSLEQVYVARFVSGVAANAMYVTLPMYIAECSQPEVRGLFGSMVYIMSMIGVLVAYSIIPFMPLWTSSLLPACLNTIMLITFFFQPESPYYLLKCSRNEDAKKSLQHLRTLDDISNELSELSVAVARQEAEKGRPLDLFRTPSNCKATLIMLLLNTAQNMAGVSVVVMNAQYLLQEAANLGGVQSPLPDEWAAITFAAIMLVAAILGAVFIDKYGRRFLLISSGILSALFLALLAIYYAYTDIFVHANLTWIPLFAMVGYAFAFKSGLGLVPIVVSGEVFPSSIKALGMVLSDLYFTVIATLSLQVYYLTAGPVGLYVPFVIFALCTGTTTFLVWVYVPETKGKSLEEIQMILKQQTEKKKNNIHQ